MGRAEHQSYCFLFTESESQQSAERLQALAASRDGFALAEKDLEFRGPGEVYGVSQHGFNDTLKIAKLTDYVAIKQAQEVVQRLMQHDPHLESLPQLRKRVDDFSQRVHLE